MVGGTHADCSDSCSRSNNRRNLERGEYAAIPLAFLLLILGLLMFFIQASSLAPFIYSLF